MGPDASKHIRNILIILLLAVAVWLLPGGDVTGQIIYSALMLVFVCGLLFFGYRIYMENRETIFTLSDRMRALLYGCIALAAIVLIATPRLWSSGLGIAVWLTLMGLAGWGGYVVYRAYRSY